MGRFSMPLDGHGAVHSRPWTPSASGRSATGAPAAFQRARSTPRRNLSPGSSLTPRSSSTAPRLWLRPELSYLAIFPYIGRMANSQSLRKLSALLQKLVDERRSHMEEIQRIDSVFTRMGFRPSDASPAPTRAARQSGRAASGKRRGRKAGGQRVQGVKQALLDSLTDSPQTPAQLQVRVSNKVGANVAIVTQLAMLKREKLAKAVARGQWIRV